MLPTRLLTLPSWFSAVFDTIDHSIILHSFSSCFGITDTTLTWFNTYLPSRSFSVLTLVLRNRYPLSCGVPQGPVLGPVLFDIYTTPLGTLISSRSLNHHLYADDTQLLIPFAPKTFTTAINKFQDTISDISSWVTTNTSLILSKTENIIYILLQQISTISNHYLTSLKSPNNPYRLRPKSWFHLRFKS